ncbi:outer membrane beta-barrel protein [uncultured Rhodoblastus sp.]|uniref:outer membrane protein n=1 Tax=uncultured Rhodoblastus sp. TaxID=543037 RepID=UPI0025D52665|nr:outer membrane beta-barrel protein [uncultured Rhodoblastus sp.]
MIRAALRLSPLFLALALPAAAADLPYFAGGDPPPLITKNQAEAEAQKNPWTGLVMGAQTFAVSGMGRGTHGGFGGGGYLGYNREFDNNIVVGVSASAGYLPGLYSYGPRRYNYGMANVNVGYDMGRFMPYVTFGVGLANATNSLNRSPGGFDSLDNLFNRGAQSITLTTIGAGFNYAVTDHLAVGVQVNAVQQHGGGYGGPVPQPGWAGIP